MSGLPYEPADLAHASLIALLMSMGGSADLPVEYLAPDVTGGPDGAFHSYRMDPMPGGVLRLSVVVRPAAEDEGGVRHV
ncbi:pRL2-19 [Streptomyces sp. NPDC054855]